MTVLREAPYRATNKPTALTPIPTKLMLPSFDTMVLKEVAWRDDENEISFELPEPVLSKAKKYVLDALSGTVSVSLETFWLTRQPLG